MPARLADQLQDRQEFLDLARFLSLLGRPGPYANDESPVIRKWRFVTAAQSTSIPQEQASWMPAYSLVNGTLPLQDLDGGAVVFARGFVTVQAAGAVKLLLNDTRGLRLWVDGREISDLAAPIKLSPGRRTFTFSVNRSRRGMTGLRAELAQAPGSPVKFRPEGGI